MRRMGGPGKGRLASKERGKGLVKADGYDDG